MSELNENDRERIHSTFKYGTEFFTEADLEKVRENRDAAEKKAPFLKEQFGIFVLLWSLLQDYWSGEYKAVPWKLIASIGFAATYLVSPLDIVPDFIPLLGFVDDAAVFGLVASSFQSELDAYKRWKEEQGK